ncbi:MAG: hypothetical protein KF716_26440 [Anaerolineae bacterium]|nr:hypothetical protein [Anaerolineae bacterium]
MSFLRHHRSTKAQGLVEYALILALVAIAAVGVLSVAGKSVSVALCHAQMALANKPDQCSDGTGTSGDGSGTGTGSDSLIVTITQVNSQHVFYSVTDSIGTAVNANVTATDTDHLVLTCVNNKCSNPPARAFSHGDRITVTATYNGLSGQASVTYP